MKQFVAYLACLCLLFSGLASAVPTTYHVRIDGHNGASGLNDTADPTTGAWGGPASGDFNVMLNKGTPVGGDTVIVHAGTYMGFNSRTNVRDGSVGNLITYQASGTVILEKIYLQNEDYLKFDGFSFTLGGVGAKQIDYVHSNTDGGFTLNNSDFITITNSHFYDIGGYGINGVGANGSRSNYATITNNLFERCLLSLIAASDNPGGWEMHDNTILDPRWYPGRPIVVTSGVASTDVVTTAAPHGLSVDDPIHWCSVTGGAGLTLSGVTKYYVKTVPSSTTFTFSATKGGTTFNFTSDISAGGIAVDRGSWDCDYRRTVQGGDHHIQRDVMYGATVDGTQCWGTHTGSSGVSTLVSADASWAMRQMQAGECIGMVVKNTTTGATGTITANTGSTPWTFTATMSGGSRQVWNNGDGWALNYYPHVDSMQTYDYSATNAPTIRLRVEDCLFANGMSGCIFENTTNHLNGYFTFDRCVFVNGLAIKYADTTNGVILNHDTGLAFNHCTFYNYSNGFLSLGPSAYGEAFYIRDSILHTAGGISYGVSNRGAMTGQASNDSGTDYNCIFNGSAAPGTHNRTDDPSFVTASPTTMAQVLGADMLFGTADDGLRLQAGSTSRHAAHDGTDLGAYQYGVEDLTPAISITAPLTGSSYLTTDTVNFTGTAFDTEDGSLSSTISWTSSIDGALGTGASISHALTASVTPHTITASATDSASHTSTATITINVSAPAAAASSKRPNRPVTRTLN